MPDDRSPACPARSIGACPEQSIGMVNDKKEITNLYSGFSMRTSCASYGLSAIDYRLDKKKGADLSAPLFHYL